MTRAAATLLALLVLASCGDRSDSAVLPVKEGDPMTPNATASRSAPLPLDAAAPAKVETATFALG